jgi:hypothetical protein
LIELVINSISLVVRSTHSTSSFPFNSAAAIDVHTSVVCLAILFCKSSTTVRTGKGWLVLVTIEIDEEK